MGNTIRIPRTTAMFVSGLGRILRDEFDFTIVEHEHWTFTHVGKWESCGRPGACPTHGISDKNFARAFQAAEQNASDAWDANYNLYHRAENSFVPCYAYRMDAYIGVGQARQAGIGRPKLNLRVRIEQTYWEIGDTIYIAQVWAREEDGTLYKGEFGLHELGVYRTDKEPPNDPPRRIAFWRSAEEALA